MPMPMPVTVTCSPPDQQELPVRRRARRGAPQDPPLGSLTQLKARGACAACGSTRVTHLAMDLTDGTPVVLTSCHRCEQRRWEHDGETLTVTDVIERTRKLT